MQLNAFLELKLQYAIKKKCIYIILKEKIALYTLHTILTLISLLHCFTISNMHYFESKMHVMCISF